MKRALWIVLLLCSLARGATIMQSSFAGGEISPLAQARIDVDRYFQSAQVVENMIVLPQGPAIRRPGTEFVSLVDAPGRLIGFHGTESYMLLFGHKTLRIFHDGLPVVDGNDVVYAIQTPYDGNDLGRIQVWQSTDAMYIVDGLHAPQKLLCRDANDWEIESAVFTGGPYLAENTTPTTLTTDAPLPLDTYKDEFRPASMVNWDDGGQIRADLWSAQTFTANQTYTAQYVMLPLRRSRDCSAPIIVSLRAVDGSGPTGADLAVGTMNGAILGDYDHAWRWYTIALDSGVTLTQGTQYAIIVRSPGAGYFLIYPRRYFWGVSTTTGGTYAGGTTYSSTNGGSSWNASAGGQRDFGFALDGDRPEPPPMPLILTASDDIFDANHAGALFKMRQVLPKDERKDTLDANEPGSSLLMGAGGEWTLTLTGTWVGQLLIERSYDLGHSWETIARFDAPVSNYVDRHEGANGIIRCRMSEINSGSCTVLLGRNRHDVVSDYQVTDVNSPTTAMAVSRSSFVVPGSTTAWSEGAWSGVKGWPSVIASYADRLILASTAHQPLTIWGSRTGRYEDFTAGTLDDDSFGYTLARPTPDPILWLLSQRRKGLVLGTARDVVELEPLGGTSIGPGDPPALAHTIALPCASVPPVEADNVLLVLQRHGRKVREILYNYESDALVAPDLTLFADHITGSGIGAMTWTRQPYPLLWAALTDGSLVGCTYDRNSQTAGWHRHNVTGDVLSVAALDGPSQDDLWLLVRRSLEDGPSIYTVERLGQWSLDGKHLDAARTLSESFAWPYDPNDHGYQPRDTFIGMEHLAGFEATIIVGNDGTTITRIIDPNGMVKIHPILSYTIHVGLPYRSAIQTIRYDFNTDQGPTWTRRKSIPSAALNVFQTKGAQFGRDLDRLVTPAWGSGLFTGDQLMMLPSRFDLEASLWIVQSTPWPMTVRSLVVDMEMR